jgi:hypothetical protein
MKREKKKKKEKEKEDRGLRSTWCVFFNKACGASKV